MNEPLTALLIAPISAMRRKILARSKRISIRMGHRDYKVGQQIMICCHLKPWAVQADVVKVRHCVLADVRAEEYLADGFATRDAMLEGLMRFYPKVSWLSEVTVIHWDNVRGKLVDDYDKEQKARSKRPTRIVQSPVRGPSSRTKQQIRDAVMIVKLENQLKKLKSRLDESLDKSEKKKQLVQTIPVPKARRG